MIPFNYQPKILYLLNISFKNKVKYRFFFTIKQKLKKFVSSHFVLQKIIQTILQAEKIRYKIKSITKKGIKISEMVNV